MAKRILITGGAGFVGSHVSKLLLQWGYAVRALDSLVPQVHGETPARPAYLHSDVELFIGDVRDPIALDRALKGIDAVIHLASLVGVGQSMYQISNYVSVNNLGTATLLEALGRKPVECLVVASSMSVYGEGLYRDADGNFCQGRIRTIEQLKAGDWELRDRDGRILTPVPTTEEKTPNLESIYALSKYDQERMCLMIGRAYGIRSVALRLFNIYGPNQALSNPYTGVLSNFSARVLNNQPPLIYEDGEQRRDFVSVHDVARAFLAALECERASGSALNISSGEALTVREIAHRAIQAIGRDDLEPKVTGRYRSGDIRHCFADISAAREVLGWEPTVGLNQGLADLSAWLSKQTAVDKALEAQAELASRGLLV